MKRLHILIRPLFLTPASYLGAKQVYSFAQHICWIGSCKGVSWCAFEHRKALIVRSIVHFVSLIIVFSIYVIFQLFEFATGPRHQPFFRRVARKGLFYTSSAMVVQIPLLTVELIAFLLGINSRGLSAFTDCPIPLIGFLNVLVLRASPFQNPRRFQLACKSRKQGSADIQRAQA